MKNSVFWLYFHWILFPRVQLTVTKHWFTKWLGAESATNHYRNQCLPDSVTPIFSTRGRWVNLLCGWLAFIRDNDCAEKLNAYSTWMFIQHLRGTIIFQIVEGNWIADQLFSLCNMSWQYASKTHGDIKSMIGITSGWKINSTTDMSEE